MTLKLLASSAYFARLGSGDRWRQLFYLARQIAKYGNWLTLSCWERGRCFYLRTYLFSTMVVPYLYSTPVLFLSRNSSMLLLVSYRLVPVLEILVFTHGEILAFVSFGNCGKIISCQVTYSISSINRCCRPWFVFFFTILNTEHQCTNLFFVNKICPHPKIMCMHYSVPTKKYSFSEP